MNSLPGKMAQSGNHVQDLYSQSTIISSNYNQDLYPQLTIILPVVSCG